MKKSVLNNWQRKTYLTSYNIVNNVYYIFSSIKRTHDYYWNIQF